MTDYEGKKNINSRVRRNFIKISLALGGIFVPGSIILSRWEELHQFFFQPRRFKRVSSTFIGKAESYNSDIKNIILSGLKLLGIKEREIKAKRILLKPNIVETSENTVHINTHPLVVRGAIEAFLAMGASSVILAEGPGHCRDTYLLLEESGMAQVLYEDKVPFIDLNSVETFTVRNNSRLSRLASLAFPTILREVDWVVSMAKMKTHHWVGTTLSMKNLFGLMPGVIYGWPKNTLHWAGIEQCIIDIQSAVRPALAIVDGIIGMEGDGPIMGTPKSSQVIVMGRYSTTVDATSSRIMGIEPDKIGYLKIASVLYGSIKDSDIYQVGETIESVKTNFELPKHIPVFKKISYGK